MKTKIAVLSLIVSCLVSCSTIGPKKTFTISHGKFCRKVITYNYPDGVKTKMDELIYSKGWLVKETIFTQRWPNGEYHLISKDGFVLFDDGTSAFNVDSIPKPDNLIYEYFDQNYVPVIEVYKDGVRVPFLLGYEDGHQTMEYMRDPPGVYNWKDGVQYFERPFTEEEWQSHLRLNEYLNSDEYRKTLPDSLRKN